MYEVSPDIIEKKQKKFTIKMPNVEGKIGISFNFGKKEVFIGIAVATISMETIVRQRKQKVLSAPGKIKVIDIT